MKKTPLLLAAASARRGYTLVEIMLVLAIIAVLVGLAINKLSGNLDVAKDTRVQADIQTIVTQLKTYEIQALSMPTTEQGLDALVHQPTSDPVPARWTKLLDEIPVDPWNRPYQYRNPGVHNPDGFDVYSLGRTGKEGDGNIGNWK